MGLTRKKKRKLALPRKNKKIQEMGHRIKELRQAKKWSQRELAKRCNWYMSNGNPSQGRISHYECGRRSRMTYQDIETLAKTLGVPIETVVYGDTKRKKK